MRLSDLVLVALSSSVALAAPITRDTLGNAQAAVNQLIDNLKRDRDVSEGAIRRLQTKVLNYQESVEGLAAWQSYVRAQRDAVDAAETVKQFLQKVDGIYGIPNSETSFSFSSIF